MPSLSIPRLCLSLLAAACLTAATATAQLAPVVTTPLGKVQGIQLNNGTVNAYLGVRYAAPIANTTRFAYALPPVPFNGTLNATQAPPLCTQYDGVGVSGEVDCLRVNVYVPTATPPPGGFPVYVFIPGGGFFITTNISGANLVAAHQNIIQVYVNYRVGPEGYLALPGLSAEGQARFGNATSGNFGTYDPIAALQWVQSSISAFGGNPNQVTLGGESAGSIQVCYLLASPLARGLYRSVVMESGGCDWAAADIRVQTRIGQSIATSAGCPSSLGNAGQAQCMRNLSALAVAQAYYQNNLPFAEATATFSWQLFRPIVDGVVIPDYPQNLFAQGKLNKVNALFGDCDNEGGLWVGLDKTWQPVSASNPAGATWALPLAYMQNYSSSNTTAVQLGYAESFTNKAILAAGNNTAAVTAAFAQVYGPTGLYAQAVGNVTGPTVAISSVISSFFATCPTRRTGRALTAAGNDTWAFDFQYVATDSIFGPSLGAVHASDLAFFFNDQTITAGPTVPFNASQQQLANVMGQYLVNFIVSGNPNVISGANVAGSLPYWRQYNTTTDNYMSFGNSTVGNTDVASINGPFDAVCTQLWDKLVPLLSFQPYTVA